jgi:hypothetical protein
VSDEEFGAMSKWECFLEGMYDLWTLACPTVKIMGIFKSLLTLDTTCVTYKLYFSDTDSRITTDRTRELLK